MWDWIQGIDLKSKGSPFVYQIIYNRLESAILSGVLKAGDKLPPQRQLAERLNIALATVTRVYKVAEKQGLLSAKVGKGSFVSTMPLLSHAISAKENQCINLSIIKPQVAVSESMLKTHLGELVAHTDLAKLMDYNTEGGSLTDQQAARLWLTSLGVTLTDKVINICSGAQHGLTVLLNCMSNYGDCIAVEELCYPGIISAANQLGRVLVPIKMDSQGMCPESLCKACEEHDIKMVILVASHQNPTSRVMPKSRRAAIAKIVSEQELWLVDDDVYGFLSPELEPISNLIPHRSFYLNSLSKSVLPGLRVGYLVAPESFKHQISGEIRNSIWMPVPLTLALASKLILSGAVNEAQEQQIEIACRRQRLAKRILKDCQYESQENGYHIWLILPPSWGSAAFCSALKKRGVMVTSAEYFESRSSKSTNGVRISLMSPSSDDELSFALHITAKLIQTSFD
ncbi:PLP-dependent aminotransferase family protein [Paraglaciecola sp. 2405UD69-4]|uniref:aminotransferase-like domain-containing protein n=1 Tax=Paraglaciecola sp. 2405UD69-4 TaxID=3391836 RepID=UPI0039C9399E